jgi:hypothetical protein
LVTDNPTLALDAVGPSTPTVENWQLGNTSIGQNTSKARTPIGEGCQRGAFRSADRVEVPADQHLDARVGSGSGAENLPAVCLRFDIANPYPQETFSVLATSDEGGIQSDRDRRRRRFLPDRGTIPKCSAGSQSVATHGLFVVAGADRKHLLQYVSGRPIGHQGKEMGLKLIQLRCRPAMQWPVDPNPSHHTRHSEIGEAAPWPDRKAWRSHDPDSPSRDKHRRRIDTSAAERRGLWPERRRCPVGPPPAAASLRPGLKPGRRYH